MYFSARKVPKAPGLLSASGAWLATTKMKWRPCGFPPDLLKRFFSKERFFTTLLRCLLFLNKRKSQKEKITPALSAYGAGVLFQKQQQAVYVPLSHPRHRRIIWYFHFAKILHAGHLQKAASRLPGFFWL